MAKQTTKTRIVDSIDTPTRTFYDSDLDFIFLNMINKWGRANEIFEGEDKIFDENFLEYEEDVRD